MTKMGADTEQLHSLGTKLKAQMEAIDALTTTVTGALSSTTWEGPARAAVRAGLGQLVRPGAAQPQRGVRRRRHRLPSRASALAQAMGVG